MKEIHVVAAIIEIEDRILIAKRIKGEFEGLWEFPGGKVEENETNQQALTREIKEEFEADIQVNDYICQVKHQYSTFFLTMDCYRCSLINDNLILHDHSAYQMIKPFDEIDGWVPADVKVINKYREYLNGKQN